MPATRTYLQTATDEANATIYTFAGQNFGTAAADRYIIALLFARDTGIGAKSLVSATIGGVSATIVVQAQGSASGSNSSLAAVVIAAVPTGTSGDVVATWSEGMVRGAVSLYGATGIDPTAHDFASSVVADPALTLDIPANGFAIGGWTGSNVVTWTGLTEDDDVTLGASQFSVASEAFVGAETGRAISISETGVDPVLVTASFAPAAVVGGGLVGPRIGGMLTHPVLIGGRLIR